MPMKLTQACLHIISQLADLVTQIEAKDFSKPSKTLHNNTIGQHVRHTVEFFLCFASGLKTGVINYDQRTHDKLIETDKFIALGAFGTIRDFIESLRENNDLQLQVGYGADDQ